MDFAKQLASDPASVEEARRLVRDEFAGELEPGQLRELAIVVGELVDNSVRHGPGDAITVRLVLDEGGLVHGEIEDGGDGDVAIREMSDSFDAGLGLHVVDALTDRWAVYEGSTHVWFEMSPDAPGPA